MKQKRRIFSLFLVCVMLITNVLPVLADIRPLIISEMGYNHLENGKDAEIDFKVVNTTTHEQKAHLITALYNNQSNEMIHYNYIVKNIPAKGEELWGACLPIPEAGEYKVKAFAWEDMQSLKLVSNVLEVGAEKVPELDYKQILQETSTYLASKTPQAISAVGGEWSVLGLARAGHPVSGNYYEDYYQKAVERVQEEITKARPFGYKITEVQRLAIALTAMGKDATNVGGVDLVDYTWNKAKHFPKMPSDQQELGGRQGLNELVFGLITVDLRQSQQPEEATITREQIIDKILTEYRTQDGGFSLSEGGEKASVDITAMAVQSLAPYYDSNKQVKQAIDEALAVLSERQLPTGGFVGGEFDTTNATSESTAQVIVALSALGINPTEDARFIKGEHNPVSNLLSYYAGNGQFKHLLEGEADMMATEQSHYALVAYKRLLNQQNTLYDMTDVEIQRPAKVKVSLEIDRSSLATEEVLATLGYTQALAAPLQVEVEEGTKLIDVLEAAAKEHGLSIQFDSGRSYVESIDNITHAVDKEGFETLCNKFGLESAPSVFNYAGWMYTINDGFGQGVSQDTVKEGDHIVFRYSLYSGPGAGGAWVNYDWEFVEAYQALQKLVDSTDESDYVGEVLVTLKAAVEAARGILKTIDEESQGMWMYYIGQKQTSLWGPDSPTDDLQKAHRQLQAAIDRVAEPESMTVNPSGNIKLTMGETVQLEAKILPEHASQEVKYEVISGEGEKYVKVSDTGVLTPLVAGKCLAMIKATSKANPNVATQLFVNEIIEHKPQPIGSVALAIEKRTIGKGDTLSLETVDLFKGDTAWDVIKREAEARKIDIKYTGEAENRNIYISSIDGDKEFEYGPQSGWQYSINDKFPSKGVADYVLSEQDTIRLRYCVSIKGDELNRPLVNLLKTYIEEAQKHHSSDYTEASYAALQTAKVEAEALVNNPIYDSMETDKELEVSKQIGKIITALSNLEKKETNPLPPSEVPDDFMNDIGLNKDFLEMKIDEKYQIVARRLDEVIDNVISNQITHPNYHYQVVKGDSVAVDDQGEVTALHKGTSVIAVTYDELEANNQTYGAISPINTGLFVVSVTDGIDTGIKIDFTSQAEGIVNKARSYDTYYFTEDSLDYRFSIDATDSDQVVVKANGEVLSPQGNLYTAKLRNSSNIIEVVASNGIGSRTFAKVIDARKVEIIITNETDATRNDAIRVGDKVKVSFRGITPPVYKLATIYNPSFPNTDGTDGGTKVAYTSEALGGFIVGKTTQWELATQNAIEFEATTEGAYHFTGGHIDQGWWGSPLGTEKGVAEPGEPNLNASHHHSKFSQLPDFTIYVGPAIQIPSVTTSQAIQIKDIKVNHVEPKPFYLRRMI